MKPGSRISRAWPGGCAGWIHNPPRYVATIGRLLDTIEDGADYEKAWHDLHAAMEQRRKLTETEINKRQKMKLFIPVEHVLVMVAVIKQAIRNNVPEDATRQRIGQDLQPLRALSSASLSIAAQAQRN